MAYLNIPNVEIKGVAACVPSNSEDNLNYPFFKEGEAERVIASTGIRCRRVSGKQTTSSDLCATAAEKLITDLNWNKEDIDCLIFVSQTRDYIIPATSCLLQARLGLNHSCFTLDIPAGCPGWIYGLSVISSMLQGGSLKKGLLLVGDTPLKFKNKKDKTAWPLFGDAGTATALEYRNNAEGFKFFFGVDGERSNAIIIPDGGYRNPFSVDSLEEIIVEEGITRTALDSRMDGVGVFSFGINAGAEGVTNLVGNFNIDIDMVDNFFFHQANKFLNDKIRKKLKLPIEKVPFCLENFGNTSCATIPLTMVTTTSDSLSSAYQKNIACAFGVGLSWGAVYFETNNITCSELSEYEEKSL